MKNKKTKVKIFFIVLLLMLNIGIGVGGYFIIQHIVNDTVPYYLASENAVLELLNKDGITVEIPRGTLVNVRKTGKRIDDVEYRQFEMDGTVYYCLEENLVTDKADCVKEKIVYSLRNHVLTEDYDSYKIEGWIKKNEALNVSGYHELNSDGTVDYYYVNECGYISSKYVANEFVETELDSSIYSDCYYVSGGDPTKIDYYKKEEISFNDNVMPEQVKALYINAEAVPNAESYIELAKETPGINSFVVDIKDCYVDTQLAYNSSVALEYAPSTSNIPNTYEEYKENLKKLKDAGYYLIGRITAFKDDSFAIDNPQEALSSDGELYRYGYVYWPSVYSRKMWEYNVALALEACEEFGFNEIQFDYCRFPENVKNVDLRNNYEEDRCAAVTDFLRYATEILHNHHIYVSADVFGETSGSEYTMFSAWPTGYGQFWPAISNVVDAISSMPYPDHFSAGSYDVEEPWDDVYDIMYHWSLATSYAQSKTYDAAKCRTWIMAQNSDSYGIEYDASYIAAQIQALSDAGINDGYMTWNAASSIRKYKTYLDVLK